MRSECDVVLQVFRICSCTRDLGQATSALDSASERAVQKALDELLSLGGRTTIATWQCIKALTTFGIRKENVLNSPVLR